MKGIRKSILKREKEYEKRLEKRFIKFCKENPGVPQEECINLFCGIEKEKKEKALKEKKRLEKEAEKKRAEKNRQRVKNKKYKKTYGRGKSKPLEKSKSVWTFSGGRCNPK